ncbi:DUF4180 domain-containing protein [Cellulomonas sp. DKR-3]|uniref:DUF4180 domain-containing protein n=1 Tax=Cellulomonas fulva TaxID=2835530 RepID=A0ABS5TUJ7_9CELL|nr:DUF4180 domain-containing protein [Cellulomonas fulva]MBT0992813.1 DUF4180 domain-containing protein [Cellulomonas fulva]
MHVEVIGDQRVLVLDPAGAPVGAATATDLIGDAWGHGVRVVVVPVERLDPAFFELPTGVAGELTGKLERYRLHLAVVGDIAAQVAASDALRAYVSASNEGRHVWFVADGDELESRLSA